MSRPVWQRTGLALLALLSGAAVAQEPNDGQAEPTALAAPAGQGTEPLAAPRARNAYEAYEQGLYDQALQGFTDLQVELPEDPEVALNVGAAHYQMRNYADADRAFGRAALAVDPEVREQGLYNLGNSAFRQGRLEDAVQLYQAALEIDPDDEDAKFNLEFVRNEIRRRHEEAQKRRDEQQQGQDQQEQQGGEDQDQQQDQQQPQTAQDSDQDGLPDEVERSGQNPTDPQDPDTDDDGLPDGAEDLDRNGRLDPGETDPNKADTDGDGVPDAQESPPSGSGGEAATEDTSELTPEEAERYLQALEEGRPVRARPRGTQRARSDKDW